MSFIDNQLNFFNNIPHNVISQILENRSVGSWLIRKSNSSNGWTVSFKSLENGSIYNKQIGNAENINKVVSELKLSQNNFIGTNTLIDQLTQKAKHLSKLPTNEFINPAENLLDTDFTLIETLKARCKEQPDLKYALDAALVELSNYSLFLAKQESTNAKESTNAGVQLRFIHVRVHQMVKQYLFDTCILEDHSAEAFQQRIPGL